jgi:putative membrane-bound dehydrogenase-like protein
VRLSFMIATLASVAAFSAEKAGLTPAEAEKAMTVPEGFTAKLFAGEPAVTQPAGFDIDERGRLWVAEFRSYQNKREENNDRIVILEDTDGDGRFDKRTVFVDNLNCLTSVAVGLGGVWALCPPNLLFFRTKDDKPIGDPEVRLEGWATNSHNVASTLTWGPDGWLYGGQGILCKSKVGKHGAPEEFRTPFNTGVWRYHPSREVFEVVANGTTNPWGIDFDDMGEMFFINTVIGHLWHAIPGAHYKRMFGTDFNPHLYELIDQCADHIHWAGGDWTTSRGATGKHNDAGGGHAHSGLMFYLGDNFPDTYRNAMFTINLHGSRLNTDLLERSGSGFVGKHGPDFMFANDTNFRGIHVKYGPDGGVYVTDWNNAGECHSGSDVGTGRIFKIKYGEARAQPVNIDKLSDTELAQLHLHKNEWFVRQARLKLQERALIGKVDGTAAPALLKIFNENPDVGRKLRALWTLHVTGNADEEFLIKQLDHASEFVRAWAVRLLCNEERVNPPAFKKFAELAKSDPSPRVRLYVASAMQRLQPMQRWDIAEALAAHAEDVNDHNLPLMDWYGIEPLVPADLNRALSLASSTKIPLLRKFIARRAASDEANLGAVIDLISKTADAESQAALLQGVADALKGRRGLKPPEGWGELSPKLSASANADVRSIAQYLATVFGDTRALEALRATLQDEKAEIAARRTALQTLVGARAENLAPILQKLLEVPDLRGEALRGLAAFDDGKTAGAILKVYATLPAPEKTDALNTLASRAEFAPQLVAAIQQKKIPQTDLTAFTVRQMGSLGVPQVDAWIKANWGSSRATPDEKRKEIAHYKELVEKSDPKTADPGHGRAVFKKTCGQCHVLFDDGGKIGPNLTGSGRANLDYLLENMADPNAIIPQEFKVWVIKTKDGRVISGLIKSETDQSVEVVTVGETFTLPKADITSRKQSEQSMMPEGQLGSMKPEEIIDLIAYLRSKEQVPEKK